MNVNECGCECERECECTASSLLLRMRRERVVEGRKGMCVGEEEVEGAAVRCGVFVLSYLR